MVQDLSYNLCESLVENIGGVAGNGKKTPPTPITYLTQWKIVGNSEVHTDPFLTSWKVSGNSEVHTLPYPDGVVLPTGYKRCEYLQGDGTAYIEVPFGFYKTDEVYAKAAMLDITHVDKYFVSPKTWNNSNNRYGMGAHYIPIEGSYDIVFIMAYGNQLTGSGYLSPIIIADKEVREWEYKNYICSMGGSIKDYSNTSFGSETTNLRLFYGYNAATKCQIYEYRHKKANAEYRLIPCLDSNDTPCMYDVINNQAYYNSAESGSFTYKLYPQPTEIWSCGDLGQDGKYHVKISNGVTVYDIPLDEPLRKYDNDNIDTIEFANRVAVVTRKVASYNLSNVPNWTRWETSVGNRLVSKNIVITDGVLPQYNADVAKCLCAIYETVSWNSHNNSVKGIAISKTGQIDVYDPEYAEDETIDGYIAHIQGVEILYLLATPTTETIEVSPFAVSPADTYTSANVVTYSAFEHTENKEIWSCGEYSAVDGKYHILVKPQGGSIADIALDVPLRKVNDVADTIEFPSETEGKALVTRCLASFKIGNSIIIKDDTVFRTSSNNLYKSSNNHINAKYPVYPIGTSGDNMGGFGIKMTGTMFILKDDSLIDGTANNFKDVNKDVEIVCELATPTTELVDAPQIQEAESYSMVISQGAKAVGWSSFETK